MPSAETTLRIIRGKLTAIDHLMEDPSCTEIVIHGPAHVSVKRNGVWEKIECAIAANDIEGAISVIAGQEKKTVGEANMQAGVSAKLPGFRLEALLPPASISGPSLCLRRHSPVIFSLDDYIQQGVLTAEVAALLQDLVLRRENILIAGSTDSGKTTFLNSLLNVVPTSQHVLTIEIVPELLIKLPILTRWEADPEQGATVRALVKAALRYCPDRIIIGEVRGGEAYDLMLAANTGHAGSMASLHANSAIDGLAQFEMYALEGRDRLPLSAMRMRIASTFRYVFFMSRTGAKRRLTEIIKVHGYSVANEVYEYETIFSQGDVQ